MIGKGNASLSGNTDLSDFSLNTDILDSVNQKTELVVCLYKVVEDFDSLIGEYNAENNTWIPLSDEDKKASQDLNKKMKKLIIDLCKKNNISVDELDSELIRGLSKDEIEDIYNNSQFYHFFESI